VVERVACACKIDTVVQVATPVEYKVLSCVALRRGPTARDSMTWTAVYVSYLAKMQRKRDAAETKGYVLRAS
jgi:hypothetical protein